jgi:predicted cupin superfamily sugar epimerase
MKAQDWIRHLNLSPHPEGGYYKETYRSNELSGFVGFDGDRNISTAIYFLLEGKDKSHFHRIQSDELWFFHEGTSIEIIVLQDDKLETIVLGKNIAAGEKLQAVIPAQVWFGARLKEQEGYALVSCTVAPGFDFKDFELGRKSDLISSFPLQQAIIEELGYPD